MKALPRHELTSIELSDVIPAFTVNKIMHTVGWTCIDFLKVCLHCLDCTSLCRAVCVSVSSRARHMLLHARLMQVDCECGEYELFNEGTDLTPSGWLSRVRCLTIELHTWCDKDYDSVLRLLRTAGFVYKSWTAEVSIWCRPADTWSHGRCRSVSASR